MSNFIVKVIYFLQHNGKHAQIRIQLSSSFSIQEGAISAFSLKLCGYSLQIAQRDFISGDSIRGLKKLPPADFLRDASRRPVRIL